MAAGLVHVFRNSKTTINGQLFSQVFKKLCGKKETGVSLRYLYTAQFLGLDKYCEHRERIISQFGGLKDKFCNRIKESLKQEDQGMVFTEDLKNLVHMAEDKPEDLELCIKMMKKFNLQNKELRFGNFVFGPVAMRLFHHFSKPDLVLQTLQDEELQGFFDQVSSYHIALDLLFKMERYDDVLNLFNALGNRQLYGSKYPRDCVVVALAACYKQNTPESHQKSLEIIKGAREAGSTILRRGLTLASALALKQKDPKTAFEILALTPQSNYITVRNLKLLILGELNRLDDVLPILRSITNRDSFRPPTRDICQETIEELQKAVDRKGEKETSHIFEQLCRALRENNHISENTIDSLLLAPINKQIIQNRDGYTGYGGNDAYNTRRGNSRQNWSNERQPMFSNNRRAGLKDMEE